MDTRQKVKYEDNPFEDEIIAREWINSVENERGLIRDKETYPLLRRWAEKVRPKVIVEIGSGQGICADKVQLPGTQYVGVEPSQFLVERARELYPSQDREFTIGNAYTLPLSDEYADAVFSVNVWFHLENLQKASGELARILKPGGNFLISTAHPDSYSVWESFFFDPKIEGKKIDGKVRVPVNPLSRTVIYKHSLREIEDALTENGLVVEGTEGFGSIEEYKDKGIFISIFGHKPVR